MKILITGSSGFIGQHTIRYFEQDNETYGLDINAKEPDERVDITDYGKLKKRIEEVRPESIIHLAALASVPKCELDPNECSQVNVQGTWNIANISKIYGIRLVFASTAAVYGNPTILPTPISHPQTPMNLYGLSKAVAEQIVRHFLPENSVIFRLFNVYGEQCERSYVIPDTARKIIQKSNSLIQMQGTGEESRDFIYVTDVLRAFGIAIATNICGTFNLGTGSTTKIIDLAKNIANIMGEPELNFSFLGKRLGDFSINWADMNGVNRIQGWQPEISLNDGLQRTLEWFRNN